VNRKLVTVNGTLRTGGAAATRSPPGTTAFKPVELDELYAEHVALLERRLAQWLAEQGWDAAAIHAGSLVKKSVYDDQFWPFRVCPHMQQWLPDARPDDLLIVRGGSVTKLLRFERSSFWEKPAPAETETFRKVFEVVGLRESDGFVEARRHLGGRVAFVGEDASGARAWGIPPGDACPPALLAALDALRTKKTPYEVACIAEANARARAGHDAVHDAFEAGEASELDLHLLFLSATAQDDWETPYKNILAMGESAATLHHVAYGRHAGKREAQSLLVDAGATCRGYASDVTRTWTKGTGAAASTFRHLVAEVHAMQQRLCGAVRVGLPYEQLHDESHRQVGAILREVGIARASVEELVVSGATRAFYPHGLGHSLGLQTHDVGCGLRAPRADNPFLRNTSDVEVGQVFTIEPGIYFIEALLRPLREGPYAGAIDWTTVDALVPLGGVRIEDDVHVVGGDAVIRNLTREWLP
jgi:Xaa-Pro dipeptidase